MCVILSRAPVGCVRASPWPHSGGFCADDRLLEEQHVPIPRIQEARRVARRQGGKAVGRKHQAASADGRARAEARHRSDALPAGELQDRSSLLCIRTHALARTHAAREHGVHPRAHMQVDSGSHSLCVRLGLSGAVAYPSQCGKYGMQRNATHRQADRRALFFVRSRSHTTTTSPSSVRLAGAEGAFRQTNTAQSTGCGWRLRLRRRVGLSDRHRTSGSVLTRKEFECAGASSRRPMAICGSLSGRSPRRSRVSIGCRRYAGDTVARLFFRLDRFRLDQFPLGPFLLRPVPA